MIKSTFHSTIFLLSFWVVSLGCERQPSNTDRTVSQPELSANPVGTNRSVSTNGKRSPGIAEDYINTNRVIWQKPDMIIDLLGDLSGKTVADIGAGTGFFALRITPRAKKVIAIDIDSRFVNYLDSVKVLELPENMQSRLEARLAEPNDPHLKPGEVDIIMIVNTFMYIQNKIDYLKILHRGLSPQGRLLIVDFKKKRTPIGPPSEIRTPIHEVEEALYTAGYRNIQTNDTALDYQYIITAEK
ncbi:MAG TPA: class I SAM-dependent methyltransferase [Saprospiraceae bacterium]|nr:class I SAM-dependent methyltransferase [Saprospiraceae bacterium]HMP14191.1 class I SAM-dependent methyltransferase [Saprospiraceae bacterium]